MAGRPTKFSPDLGDRIVERLRKGATYRLAAEAEGVSRRTVFAWLEAAEAAEETDDNPQLVAFLHSTRQAIAEYSCELLEQIRESGVTVLERGSTRGPWQALSWLLRHKCPDEFNDKTKVEVSGPNGGPLEQRTEVVDPRARGIADNPKAVAYLMKFRRFPTPEDLDAFVFDGEAPSTEP